MGKELRIMSEEEEYVLKWIEEEDLGSRAIGYRKGAKPDMRFYIMGLLYYRYHWSESRIAKALSLNDRSSVAYGKVKPFQMSRDPIFIEHTKSLKAAFPFDFPDPERLKLHERRIRLNEVNSNKIAEFRKKHGYNSDSMAISELINLYL